MDPLPGQAGAIATRGLTRDGRDDVSDRGYYMLLLPCVVVYSGS